MHITPYTYAQRARRVPETLLYVVVYVVCVCVLCVQRALFFSKHAWSVHHHQLPTRISKYKTKSTRASKGKRGSPQKTKEKRTRFQRQGRDEPNFIPNPHPSRLSSSFFFGWLLQTSYAPPNHIKEPQMCAITFWVEDLSACRLVPSCFARCRHGRAESLRRSTEPRRTPVQGLHRLHRPG